MNVRLVSDSFLFEHITLTADDAEKAELVIGRSHRADYHIDHPQVSGLQCTLKVDMKPPHKLTLKDTSCLLYTSPSPRDATLSRMPSSA